MNNQTVATEITAIERRVKSSLTMIVIFTAAIVMMTLSLATGGYPAGLETSLWLDLWLNIGLPVARAIAFIGLVASLVWHNKLTAQLYVLKG